MSLYGDFYNNATDTKMDFVNLSRESRKSGVFTLLAFKETGRLEFISSFLQFLSYTRSLVCTLYTFSFLCYIFEILILTILFIKYMKNMKCIISMLYLSICIVWFASAYTINNNQCLVASFSIVPKGLHCSIHSYGIQNKDTLW